MSMVDGGALVGKALANEGIEKAFVLCGGHIMPIFYGMRNNGIEIVDVRHECAAVYAASSYTRVSGKTAVVVTTAGPGVGNTIAGMMEAMTLGVPVLQIGGAVTMAKRDAGDLQDMDTLRVMKTCTKWAKRATSVERLPEYVSMALRHATDSRDPGPVYLELPTNLVYGKAEEDEVIFPADCRTEAIPFGDPTLIDSAAELLANAQRPAMMVDESARFSIGGQADSVSGLSDYLKMPVGVTGFMCRGLFGDETKNPLLNTNGVYKADVVLALGCKFDFRVGAGAGIPKDAKVIQVHTDSRMIGFNLRADIGIVGGAGPVAGQLLAAVKGKRDKQTATPWTGEPDTNWPENLPGAYHSEGVPIHPARCAGEVAKFLAEEGRDWTVVSDGGEASVWSSGAARAVRPGQILGHSANGTIGTGPCQVVGAWMANRKPVLWYTGDGSFGFYTMELDTMAKQGIPVVCVISNDSAWGMIRLSEGLGRAQEVAEKGQCNTELHPFRAYDKLPLMWDGYGEAVTDPTQIVPAIKRAAASGKPAIINVEVDHVNVSAAIAGYRAMVRTDK